MGAQTKILDQCRARSRHSANRWQIVLSPSLLSQHRRYCRQRREGRRSKTLPKANNTSAGFWRPSQAPSRSCITVVHGSGKLSQNHRFAGSRHCRVCEMEILIEWSFSPKLPALLGSDVPVLVDCGLQVSRGVRRSQPPNKQRAGQRRVEAFSPRPASRGFETGAFVANF